MALWHTYEKVLRLLRSKRVKLTSVRKIILEKCVAYEGAFTAKDIVLKVQEVIPDADHTSVYRSLQLFHEHDILHFSVKQKNYSFCKSITTQGCHNEQMTSHVIFECCRCHKTVGHCEQGAFISMINAAIAKGVPQPDVTSYSLRLMGVCGECQSKT